MKVLDEPVRSPRTEDTASTDSNSKQERFTASMRPLFTPHFSWFDVFFIAVVGAAWDVYGWFPGLAVLGIGALITVAAEKHYNI